MDADTLEKVRRFNRRVTSRVGALRDRYMGRKRPLGEARLLWEIGPDGMDVRTLRARLELDSGYVSRLLRSLERDALVTVMRAPEDRRVRRVRLTRKGRMERRVLDERSDALARALLQPLSAAQRDRLVDAMGVVERLLTAGLVDVEAADPAGSEARACLQAYFSELDQRFEGGFDVERSLTADARVFSPPTGVFLLARLHDVPVGCAGLYYHSTDRAEIKRMWVSPDARGLGLGRRLLAELEERARAQGCRRLQLETNRVLKEAIGLYTKSGFREVAPYNAEPYAHHWFEKRLGRAR